MKKVFLILILSGVMCNIYGQTKEDDIITLLKVSGSDVIASQIINTLMPQLRNLVPDIPEEVWDKIMEKMDMDSLFYACIPVYDKYYTHEEIKALIKFYKSPLGKKVVEVSPAITMEAMKIGEEWGGKIAQDIVNELLENGYLY
ncbi:MAG: DUF2059 domain-containing protein [Spirochaetaceae bacterium]|jgi:hypothetical protein|nr:DUF2059 domain-containing protein [Spirochaetaceae bacterium]